MATPWPHDTQEKLEAAGYRKVDETKCASPSCTVICHWYNTPKGKFMPFERMADGTLQPHFATCPESRKFSRKATGIEERQGAA